MCLTLCFDFLFRLYVWTDSALYFDFEFDYRAFSIMDLGSNSDMCLTRNRSKSKLQILHVFDPPVCSNVFDSPRSKHKSQYSDFADIVQCLQTYVFGRI